MRLDVQTPPVPAFDANVGTGNEVRMNKASYEFVRTEKLFSIEGQIDHVLSGRLNLNFPANAKAIKAQWRKIKEGDKARYHWAEVTRLDGTKEPWGLTALHITTKDLPNWFWATFEHIDNKPPGQTEGGENEGWQNQSVDRHSCPQPPHNCEGIPAGMGLERTKWANYRLRGTQVDFVTSAGTPTKLANSQIERGFQRSSCITCHALSAMDKQGNDPGFAVVIGSPLPSWFQDPAGATVFMQRDFVWSLSRASRRSP